MADATDRRAAELLQTILGGSVVCRDTSAAAPNTHDFDLQLPGGGTAAVEVTRVTDQDQRSFWAAVHKRDWHAPSLQRSWALDLVPSIKVNTLQAQIEPLLPDLERCNISELGLGKPIPEEGHAAVQQLKALGVKAGCSLDREPPRILISTTGGGTTHPDIVSSVIGCVARRADNRAKLRRALATDDHLFVWIEEVAHQVAAAVKAIRDLGITPSPVDLPEEVETVWIAKPRNATGQVGEDLWRFGRSVGWKGGQVKHVGQR